MANKKASKKPVRKKTSRKKTTRRASKASGNTRVHDEETTQTLEDLLQDRGFEEASSSSYQMPFLRILQKLSPECDEDNPKYIEGAAPGHILHTVNREIYDEVTVIPLKYKDSYIEWVPRTKGGGFVSEWDALDPATKERLGTCVKDDRNANILPNENEFTLHSNYFCAFEVADGVFEPVMISMSKSQLKTSRIWLSTLRNMRLEHEGKTYDKVNIRSFQWTLSTEKLMKDDNTWYGWMYAVGDNTLMLPQIGPIQAQVTEALSSNLLQYDRTQQGDVYEHEADSENAL